MTIAQDCAGVKDFVKIKIRSVTIQPGLRIYCADRTKRIARKHPAHRCTIKRVLRLEWPDAVTVQLKAEL